jgi:two-component system LytT family response regulator
MKWQVMIVDDEHLARKNIQALLQDRTDIQVTLNTGDPKLALELLLREAPHILFLDIKMPGLSGVDLLRELMVQGKGLPYVIFVTAYDQYAVEAFELQALDYLVKPFSDTRFEAALNKAIAQAQIGEQAALLEKMLRSQILQRQQPILLETESEIVRVDPQEIYWIEAADHYLVVHTQAKPYIVRKTLTELMTQCPEDSFLQVHRSACVNLSHVQSLQRKVVGGAQLVLSNGATIKVSRRRLTQVKEALQE